MPVDPTIMVTAVLLSVCCASIGVFLVLRQMAMMSDAISHAVLPGIVVAVFLVGGRETIHVVIGGVLMGILTVSLVELICRSGKLREDSAIGIVFPALFSIGVIMITQAGNVHIDTQHVLYGAVEFVPFDTIQWGSDNLGPKSLWVLSFLGIANLAFIALFYKELKLSTFDRTFAMTIGMMPALVHYMLMVIVATTVVVAFELVGAILVIAILIVPPSTAYLLTDRLSYMLVLSITIGIISTVSGYVAALAFDVSIAGAMATTAGVIFGIVWVAAPRRGLVSRWKGIAEQRLKFHTVLALLYITRNGGTTTITSLNEDLDWGDAFTQKIIHHMLQNGIVEDKGDGISLTGKGRTLLESSDVP